MQSNTSSDIHLRLLRDQVRCRARAQRELAKVEHEYLLKRLENPALAQATEVEAEKEAAAAAAGELTPSPGGRKAKRPRTTPRMRVEREIVMSPKDAEEEQRRGVNSLPPILNQHENGESITVSRGVEKPANCRSGERVGNPL